MKTSKKGLFIILSSPSGAGKTTLAKKLLKNNKNIELSISYTTRKKRTLEKNSKDYNFVSVKEFKKLKKKKYFIEWAKVFNNYYGTSLIKVKKINNKGKDVLFDIDWQGSRKIKKRLGKDVVSIFILPPSKKELTGNDLSHKSSFNTYLIHGLPKGPICNPGKESIIAVTNPSKGDLLYFVADGEGGHNFSSNYQKHIENVKKFKEFSMEKYWN